MTVSERAGVVARACCVDAVWNFQRHQNAGFLYLLLPSLRKRWAAQEDFTASLKRHVRYLSTHPAMVPALAGLAVSMEERMKQDKEGAAKDLQRYKALMMGPLAAIGDAFFWSALKPLVLVSCVAGAMILPTPAWKISVCAALLAAYNLVRLSVMWEGVTIGYERGIAAVSAFQGLPGWVVRLHRMGILMTAGAAALLLPAASVTIAGQSVWSCLFPLALVVAFAGGLKIRISSTTLFYLVMAVCIVLAYAYPVGRLLALEAV